MNPIYQASWITSSDDYKEICPVFKKTFSLAKPVKKAVLTISSLGVYEAVLNGSRVGDFILAPGFTSYRKRLLFQEYDIKDLLESQNELFVTVSNGWCVGELGWSGHHSIWSDRRSLIAVISIFYQDDTFQIISTDESWMSAKSPILYSEIYHGETYAAGYIPHHWKNAVCYDYSRDMLTPQDGEEIHEIDFLPAAQIIHTPAGETVIDFQQNITGYVEFQITGPKGHQAEIYHAEILDHNGNFYTDNLRSAKQKITYLCGGTENETYKPHMTFQGFRYIKLVNWPEEVKLSHFKAIVVHSDLKRTGNFTCSHPKLNRLFSNIIWGQKGNFLDIPTDCPQRDERLGWTGDAQVFIKTASYNFNVEKFFTKWLRDLKADQLENGGVPFVIPDALQDGGNSSAAWGDAAVICPWQIYLTYGNPKILEEQFDSMKKWVDYIRAQGDCEYLWNTGFHFGDWLGLDAEEGSYKGATDESLIASAYFAYSTSLLIKAGNVLNKDMSSYKLLYQNIKKSFQDTYIKDGKMVCDTQTSYVLALHFNLCKEEDRKSLASHLNKMIKENNTRLKTGFVGTPYLLHALSDNGYAQTAYSLLLQEAFPSWLYSVNMGATTIWEHWDGLKEDGSMWSADMNSFNHYSYGAVADWIYETMLGIRTDENEPGFRHIIFKPIVDTRLDYAKASIETRYGTVSSQWSINGSKAEYRFIVPEGCHATVIINDEIQEISQGETILEKPI